MSNKKYNRYKNVRKKLLAGASTGILAGMILMGGTKSVFAEVSELSIPAYTEGANVNGMHMMHKWNSNTKASSLAIHLGLDPAVVKEELKSGKTLKQILQENGIVPGQLQKAFENSPKKRHNKNW